MNILHPLQIRPCALKDSCLDPNSVVKLPRKDVNPVTNQVLPLSQAPGVKERLVHGLGFLPQNLASYLLGLFVRISWPSLIQSILNRGFVGIFNVNMREAEKPLASYSTIEDIFTRALAPNQRRIHGGYVSSADGVLEISNEAQTGSTAVQAKGITYSLSELVFGHKNIDFAAKWYTTVYLAPHNYHRVHSPVAGRVTSLRYIPGRLWPVNRPAVRAIPGLFCRNERLVFSVDVATGGKAWVVMVGAFNVGRMSTRLSPQFVTNAGSSLLKMSAAPVEVDMPAPIPILAGDELGIFMLGSTTVVVLDDLACQGLKPKEFSTPQTVSMGQSLAN
jgi:phosphatidylserine decarboxylase